jgi:hypothetical protein
MLKDPSDVRTYYIVWASRDATNDGSSSDLGELQSETISTSTWIVPTGITKDSDAIAGAITLRSVTYDASNITSITLSSGTAGVDYDLVNQIVTSGSRTIERTITILCRDR